VTVALLSGGLGVLAGLRAAEDGETVSSLSAEVDALRARVERVESERDRLRQERNQLEARLAAEEPPRVCPSEFLSTGTLLPLFAIDYPCGWHVLFDPASPTAGDERPGLQVEVVVVGRLPISLAPRDGPLGEFELLDWSDDPADQADALAPLADWVSEERARFSSIEQDERFEAAEGITVHRLTGVQPLFDEPVEVHTMFWEYTDSVAGARHVVRTFSLAPSARTVAALDRLARSFRVRR